MNALLNAVAQSLDRKAAQSKTKAEAETYAALDADDNLRLQLAVREGMRSTIYAEIAASIREAIASVDSA